MIFQIKGGLCEKSSHLRIDKQVFSLAYGPSGRSAIGPLSISADTLELNFLS
jgi:hypothetical protein